MTLRILFLFTLLLTGEPLHAKKSQPYRVVFQSHEWADIGHPTHFSDDLVVMRDGTKIWGRLTELPGLSYPFETVSFKASDVTAFAVLSPEKMQVVTRDGHNYIGSPNASTIHFSRRIKDDAIGSPYSGEVLQAGEVNFVLLRQKKSWKGPEERDFLSIVMINGDRFPAILAASGIPLSDGWKSFTLRTGDIIDVRFQGGLQGYIRGEALNRKLPFSFVEEEFLPIRFVQNNRPVKLPWNSVARIQDEMGEFVLMTPFIFSKWSPDNMVFVPPGRFIVGPKRKGTAGHTAALASQMMRRKGMRASDLKLNLIPTLGSPSELVEMPGFFIDRYEVTNEEYQQFVEATGIRPPTHWVDGRLPSGKERYPVVNVSCKDAESYARWAGKRLPSELEWERMAKGASGFKYAYGEAYSRNLGNTDGGGTEPVGSYRSAIEGQLTGHLSLAKSVHDVVGNVAEWTASSYHYNRYWKLIKDRMGDTPYKKLPRVFKVLRGGSFLSSSETATATHRSPMHEDDYNESTGFRCAADVRPGDPHHER